MPKQDGGFRHVKNCSLQLSPVAKRREMGVECSQKQAWSKVTKISRQMESSDGDGQLEKQALLRG